jgi:hypothetical protein
MAVTTTTLASAKALNDRYIKLTSATGIANKMLVRVDQEIMRVVDITLTPVIGVVPGYYGSAAMPHGTLSPVAYGIQSDFVQAFSINPQVEIVSAGFGIDGAITGPGGAGTVLVTDTFVTLNKATAGAYTQAAPANDQTNVLTFISETAAAHTVTFPASTLKNSGAATTIWTFTGTTSGGCLVIKADLGTWKVLSSSGGAFS